ncbi:MAG: hypothetical protein LJE65_00090 [Desulfobacteraceae bacterium]|nr:hypothetical protein [Desulfobacteraceae bacterium]
MVRSNRLFIAIVCFVLALAANANAESVLREIGRHPFYGGPLMSMEDLKGMTKTMGDELKQGFAMAGHADLYPALVQQLPTATVEMTLIHPGTTLEWMLFKRNGKGRVRVSKKLTWGGKQSIEAYRFFVDNGGSRYEFVVPTACGNVALLGFGTVPPPPPPPPKPVAKPVVAPPVNQAPGCRLSVSASEVVCGKQVTVNADASDDTDGTVASVVFRLVDPQGRTVLERTDDQRPFVQDITVPCDAESYTVQAVAVDDDGAESDPSTCNAVVTAKKPRKGGGVVDLGGARQFDPATYVFGRIGYEYPLTEKLYIMGMLGAFGRVSGEDSGSAFVADATLNYHWYNRFSFGLGLGYWGGDDQGPLDENAHQLDVIGNVGYLVYGDPEGLNTTLFFEIRSGTDEFDELDSLGRYGFGIRMRF